MATPASRTAGPGACKIVRNNAFKPKMSDLLVKEHSHGQGLQEEQTQGSKGEQAEEGESS